MRTLELFTKILMLGISATIIMDLYAFIIKKFFNIPSLDYALVGRWFLYLFDGKLVHNPPIFKSGIRDNEKAIGWFLHYLIGVIFAFIFIILVGQEWFLNISFIYAVAFGLVTVIFPFFILQPCLGFGIAASKTSQPSIARIRSALAHLSFGFGLYLAGYVLKLLFKFNNLTHLLKKISENPYTKIQPLF